MILDRFGRTVSSGNQLNKKTFSGKRTWIKPGGQQIVLNMLPETEKAAREAGFVPHIDLESRPDINIRINRLKRQDDM